MKDFYVELKKQIKGVKEHCKLTIFGFSVNILSTLHIENFVNRFMFHFWGREIP